MSSKREPRRRPLTSLSAEAAIAAYMNEPDEGWLEGPDGPMFFRKRQPTEEDLAWDKHEIEMDEAMANWKPDSYDD